MEKVYTIWDAKVEVYMPPFLAMNKGEAIRRCENWMLDPNTPFARTPQDFSLFEIAEFDLPTGQFHLYEKKIQLVGLWELKKSVDESPEQPIPLVNRAQRRKAK